LAFVAATLGSVFVHLTFRHESEVTFGTIAVCVVAGLCIGFADRPSPWTSVPLILVAISLGPVADDFFFPAGRYYLFLWIPALWVICLLPTIAAVALGRKIRP